MATGVKLGQRVKDTVTGYEGIVVARNAYLGGTVMVLVQAEVLGFDGGVKKPEPFAESMVEVVPDAEPVPCPSEEPDVP